MSESSPDYRAQAIRREVMDSVCDTCPLKWLPPEDFAMRKETSTEDEADHFRTSLNKAESDGAASLSRLHYIAGIMDDLGYTWSLYGPAGEDAMASPSFVPLANGKLQISYADPADIDSLGMPRERRAPLTPFAAALRSCLEQVIDTQCPGRSGRSL